MPAPASPDTGSHLLFWKMRAGGVLACLDHSAALAWWFHLPSQIYNYLLMLLLLGKLALLQMADG